MLRNVSSPEEVVASVLLSIPKSTSVKALLAHSEGELYLGWSTRVLLLASDKVQVTPLGRL